MCSYLYFYTTLLLKVKVVQGKYNEIPTNSKLLESNKVIMPDRFHSQSLGNIFIVFLLVIYCY